MIKGKIIDTTKKKDKNKRKYETMKYKINFVAKRFKTEI